MSFLTPSDTLLDTLYATMDALHNRAALTLEAAFVDLIGARPGVERTDALNALCAPFGELYGALRAHLTLEEAGVSDAAPRFTPIYVMSVREEQAM